ncbi:MAG TPA: DUF1028 domain-containing protein [Stackebrandtia sp.]|jgi:uncharacterized Ntn-hydrolase superfamily protein|uniref:DUF1028 domain-containing protein n=1 Tax=Stackebrandtia sp. TaxID=2023065 RepID=UPI002D63549E|nr:DUF1028 domain-containing protein [Stackebrandtia sp.]HZE40439.1 DUF1028 domain-containing protein [Stackebrandtia sp.]
MTFSIVARSDDGLFHGVAVASKFLAVGAAVPAARAEVGALATQAYANLAFGPQGLTLLDTGVAPEDTVAALIAGDRGRGQRQLGVVGTSGSGATYTGDDCPHWAGGHAGPGYAIQGNILTGPQVVDAMRDTWCARTELDFARRLLAALAAGDAAGGDRRGRQSAAIHIVGKNAGYGGTSDLAMDLRVDDHADPVTELGRLVEAHHLYFGTPEESELLALSDGLAEEVSQLLARLGHTGTLETAINSWAGIANLEERLVPGKIDPLVLDQLRRDAAE